MTLSGIGELPLFKKRSSGVEEFEALLDLLPHPTIIADGRGRVFFANAQATQLTAYTRREFAELDLATLLPEYGSVGKDHDAHGSAQPLITRNSRSLQVKVKSNHLGGSDHWIAIYLEPALAQDESSEETKRQRWEAIHILSLAAQQDDLGACFRQILQAGRLLTGATNLAIYGPAEDTPDLTLETVLGSGFEFPASLVAAEFSHLRTPKIWQIGKPIESLLQRMANSGKFAYLATSPLDLTTPGAGLLVCADASKLAPNDLAIFMQILAAAAAAAASKAGQTGILQADLSRLMAAEEVRNAIHENIQDGLVYVDPSLRLLDQNPAAEELLGYSAAEVRGRAANDVLISAQPLLPALEQAVTDGSAIDLGERKIHRRDGSEFLASLRVVPILSEGIVHKLVILITDLSEHEAFHLQNQQLEQRAAIGEITAIFAHEVRNPINSISTGLQLMKYGFQENDPMLEQVNKLQEDVDRLEHRLKSVDAFSRNLESRPEPLDIGVFCRAQLDRWRSRLARKNIKDHINVAPDTPYVMADQRALDQVFTNLITNAVQAMEDQGGGTVAIKVRPDPVDNSMIEVQVSDTGPGMPEEIRNRVFEPFFTTKGQEGTGLGLAITRRIILAHKGNIECESFPGGTLFKIQLPVAPNPSKEGTPA